jgi:hypothetical protein
LREARRKTGAASSRELARLLREQAPQGAPQETRPEDIVMAGGGGTPQGDAADVYGKGARGPLTKGASAMIFLALGAAAEILVTGERSAEPPAQAAQPRVVATFPAAGARIAPGRYALSVTFDRPMRAGSYSFVTTGAGAYPDCESRPRQPEDRQTFTLRCVARAGQRHSIGFNSSRFRNFVSADDGRPAEPAMLSFSVR